MTTTLDQLVVQLSADIKGLRSALSDATGEINRFNSNTRAQARATQDAIDGLTRKVREYLTVWAAFEVGKSIVDAGMQLQSLQNRLVAATGSADVAKDSLAFLREESNRLGLDFRSTAESFGNFSASALRAGMTLGQTKGVFTAVAEAATALHLSTAQTNSAFLALEQMASKGTVQMQELKLQLAQAIPGAFEIMAKAMGVSVAQFNQMISRGEVLASDALPKLGEELHREFGERAVVSADSAQAAFNRFGNALFDLKTQLANGGFLDAVTKGVKELTDLLNDPQTKQGLQDFATLLGSIAHAALTAASAIGSFFSAANDRKQAIEELTALGRAATPDNIADMVNTIQLRRQAINAPSSGAAAPAAGPNLDNYTLGSKGPIPISAAAQHAADARAALRNQVNAMSEGFISETNPNKIHSAEAVASLNKRYAEEQTLLEKALKKKAITEQEYNKQSLKAELDYNTRLAAIHKQYRDQFLSDEQAFAEGFLGVQFDMQDRSLSEQGKSFRDSIDQAGQHYRVFFELSKAAAIAQALIKAKQTVVDAYEFGTSIGGPALGLAFAGVAAAAQAANIQAIASTSFNGGGVGVGSSGGGGASGGGDTSNGSAASAPVPATKSIFINLHGNDTITYSKKQIRDLISAINDAVGDGTRLAVSSS